MGTGPDTTRANESEGHRARLRARLLADADGLLDHELVEYLLALAMPRIDTKPHAKRLLAEFGSLGGLFAADPESLLRVKGIGEGSIAALKIVNAVAVRMLRGEIAARPILSSWQALLDYLHVDMAHITVERVRVLHLNTKNVLIRDELVSEGSIDQASVHVREVIKRAIELGSAAIILVHNHPSGDPKPSREDVLLTRDIIEAGRRMSIEVHDHIIIGTHGHTSMRELGLI